MVAYTQVIPGDDHHLLLTALVTITLQLVCFVIAYLAQFDKITDFAGSANFVLLALLTFFLGGSGWAAGGGEVNARAAIATGLVVFTRVELALYLLYRVLKRGKDERFDAIRLNFLPFLGFWIFQMVWVWVVCLPVMFVNTETSRAPLGAADGVGIAMWAVGLTIQIVSDLQKNAFRMDPANNGKWCDAGLWYFSRHPNYFGEILREWHFAMHLRPALLLVLPSVSRVHTHAHMHTHARAQLLPPSVWWGIFVLVSPQFSGATSPALGWSSILSPILTMLLLLALSGIPTAEGKHQLRFMRTPEQAAAYARYREMTSPLIPLPTSLYASIPLPIKQWLLFEWKMYEVPSEAAGAVATENTMLQPVKK
jgi:steroid 5-alpha reductase family enzyme